MFQMEKLWKFRSISKVASLTTVRTAASSSISGYEYETLVVSRPKEFVLHVELNRPEKLNAMNRSMWSDTIDCFNKAAKDPDVRAIILSGRGKMFTAGNERGVENMTRFLDLVKSNREYLTIYFGGLDLMSSVQDLAPKSGVDVARRAITFIEFIKFAQESCNVIEKCNKPVIAAVHNGCLGGGIDTITACDIRLQTNDAWYSVKEVDVGLAADLGTLQRLPKIIGNDSLARELCFTARPLKAAEAKECGLVSHSFETKEEMIAKALELAETISSKSPVAVQGTKLHMNYSRGRSVQEGLDYMVHWNACMLQSEDVMKSAEAFMTKKTPTYSKL